MMVTITIQGGEDFVTAGPLALEGGLRGAKPSAPQYGEFLERLAAKPIRERDDEGEPVQIDPAAEPERFLRALHPILLGPDTPRSRPA